VRLGPAPPALADDITFGWGAGGWGGGWGQQWRWRRSGRLTIGSVAGRGAEAGRSWCWRRPSRRCQCWPVCRTGPGLPGRAGRRAGLSPRHLWSDWLTRELYDFLPGLGVTTITTSFSRFVADVNRDPATGSDSFYASVVCARMPRGQPLYRRPLRPAEISYRVQLAHEPFHRALDEAVAGLLAQFPRLVLLDLHSFGSGLDGDIILGDRRG